MRVPVERVADLSRQRVQAEASEPPGGVDLGPVDLRESPRKVSRCMSEQSRRLRGRTGLALEPLPSRRPLMLPILPPPPSFRRSTDPMQKTSTQTLASSSRSSSRRSRPYASAAAAARTSSSAAWLRARACEWRKARSRARTAADSASSEASSDSSAWASASSVRRSCFAVASSALSCGVERRVSGLLPLLLREAKRGVGPLLTVVRARASRPGSFFRRSASL
jgi:hypothetical protein